MANSCPKCGTPKDGESCPKCGLVFSKFDPQVLEESAPDSLKELWRHAEENWDDRASHALFIEHALMANSLGYAAGCYRRREEDPTAKAQLNRIEERMQQVMAASAAASATEKSGQIPKWRPSMVLISVLIAVILAFLLFGFILKSK